MAKRKNRSKRSLGSLPKGIPHKQPARVSKLAQAVGATKGSSSNGAVARQQLNPFEFSAGQKRPKHQVHNRFISTQQQKTKEPPLKRRSQQLLKQSLQRAKKANVFVDKRIGEYDRNMTVEEQNLARLVRERSRRSKKSAKFSLQDDDHDDGGDHDNGNGGLALTHGGKVIDDETAANAVLMSDDDDDDGHHRQKGQLDAMDTALHFGGGDLANTGLAPSPYGPAAGGGGGGGSATSMAANYSQRKTELDDLIMRRKLMKAEKSKAKEQQEEVIADLDDNFSELASLLQFRDKEQEIRKHIQKKRDGTLDGAAREMEEWDQEIREYSFLGKRAKATDRTKTPEEIAKEEAEELHKKETRRLARMNGDFSEDEFSDVSDEQDEDDDEKKRSRKRRKKDAKKKKKKTTFNPDELEDDSDDDDKASGDEELKAKFTSEGLVYVNKKGEVVKRVGEAAQEIDDEDSKEESSDSEGDCDEDSYDDHEGEHQDATSTPVLKVGQRVHGNYRASEQFEDRDHWYEGVISKVNIGPDETVTYNVDYDDGDFEEDMEPENVRPIKKSKEEESRDAEKKAEEMTLQRKRQKAKEKARGEIPFVFEVPTTLEALHGMIGNYASTGEDASLIIQRIHAANSVRLDRRNGEKMQNFYDVLLRRFVAVGDAIYSSGDGGAELGRHKQLDAITKVLYKMTQDSPDCAAAVWGRRLGILQNAHAKRLRDAEFEQDGDEDMDEAERSAWPSVGTVLLLRLVGHLFPVTDRRHNIVTPVLLLLGQMLAQTPVETMYDLVLGTMCSGLLIEYTKEAKRVAPEALGFLAGVLRLFAHDPSERTQAQYPVPTLKSAAVHTELSRLRSIVSNYKPDMEEALPSLFLEKSKMEDKESASASVLVAVLHLSEGCAQNLSGSLGTAERETFAEITSSLLCLKPNSKTEQLPPKIRSKIATTATAISEACKLDQRRAPLMRRHQATASETALKSLAPRLEDPDRYSKSKDKGKTSEQVAIDRTRREYKREHKAVARELRLDAAFIEKERRKEEETKTTRARTERQKNFAWLESEQAAMNQQVRQGGGLLKGGGMGAAKNKAKSAKLGMKKGGKF